MTNRIPKQSKAVAALPADYAPLLADIKARVQVAQIKAGLAANRELLVLYWDIGRLILDRQRKEGWESKVIDRLSADLQNEFPGQQGFSPRNLKYMRAFAEAWPETLFVHQPVAQLGGQKIEAGNRASATCTIGSVGEVPVGAGRDHHVGDTGDFRRNQQAFFN